MVIMQESIVELLLGPLLCSGLFFHVCAESLQIQVEVSADPREEGVGFVYRKV